MDAHKERDRLFADIHSTLLKPLGFKKKGHWSVLSRRPFHWAVYLRSSRWSRKNYASFWIDLYVYHEQFDSLMFGPRSFSGPAEGTPGLVTEDLGRITNPTIPLLEIDAMTDIGALRELLLKSISDFGLPLFSSCDSLEKIAKYYSERNIPAEAPSVAGIYLLLGRENDARQAIIEASKMAPNEHVREWNDKCLKKMIANKAFDIDAQVRQSI
jgi:hypothetical protein